MSGRSKAGGNARAEREKRLAEALRLNLKRRKTQARERSETRDAADRTARKVKGESG